MVSHADDLALIAAAAREAAGIAMGFFRADPQVWWKEGDSPVSEADLAVDRYLRDALGAARPSYGWVSEETEASAGAGPSSRFFVVDPIDGTRSFLRGEATWCVSIAVIENGRPVAGVIDAPALGEIFTAEASGPARLNGAAASVSRAGPAPLYLAMPDALRRRLPAADEAGLAFGANVPTLAYRLALVACGRLDGTLIQARANDWDIAAGDLIVERAGGHLVGAGGRRHLYKLETKRHGLLIAAADHALARLQDLAGMVGDAR